MPKFRKKPVVIEAFQYGVDDPPRWAREAETKGTVVFFSQHGGVVRWCEIETLEGRHRAELGDYIIQGVQGEIYPCKPDIFAATYEETDA